jgi:hypothetical protein
MSKDIGTIHLGLAKQFSGPETLKIWSWAIQSCHTYLIPLRAHLSALPSLAARTQPGSEVNVSDDRSPLLAQPCCRVLLQGLGA